MSCRAERRFHAYYSAFQFIQDLLIHLLASKKPNATAQPRLEAGAQRTL